MPDVGATKTVGGVTGVWDGTGWRRVDTPAREVGARKTVDGVTGEWDGSGWRRVEHDDGSGAMTTAAGLGGAAAATAIAPSILTRIAESPALANAIGKVAGAGKLIPGVGTGVATAANVGLGITRGEDPTKLGVRALTGAATGYGAKLLKEGAKLGLRQIQPAAAALGDALGLTLGAPEGAALGLAPEVGAVGSAPLAVPLAGGLAGVAGTTAFLGALQHDANRKVTIDYSKNTPDTAVARVFSNMATSEKNRGRSLDERQDDPSDVMFSADDAETVRPDLARAAVVGRLGAR